jgi:hypothetical protein
MLALVLLMFAVMSMPSCSMLSLVFVHLAFEASAKLAA